MLELYNELEVIFSPSTLPVKPISLTETFDSNKELLQALWNDWKFKHTYEKKKKLFILLKRIEDDYLGYEVIQDNLLILLSSKVINLNKTKLPYKVVYGISGKYIHKKDSHGSLIISLRKEHNFNPYGDLPIGCFTLSSGKPIENRTIYVLEPSNQLPQSQFITYFKWDKNKGSIQFSSGLHYKGSIFC